MALTGFSCPHFQNMVTENQSKSIAPPKGSKPFKKSDLPDGLNYEVLCCTIIPTVIAYYAHQKDPWNWPQSILCNKIHVILRSASGMDFNINPKGSIYKNVHIISCCHYYPHSFIFSGYSTSSDSWWAIIGSVLLALITTYIFKNQESGFTTQEQVMVWAKEQLIDYHFLYSKAKGDNKCVCYHIFDMLYLFYW